MSSEDLFAGAYIPYAKPPKGQHRLVRAVSSWFSSGEMRPNVDPIRDFRFDTGVGIVYFSTRADLCEGHGFHHGDRVQITKGALTGALANVVGVRGSTLYVVFDNESTASPLLDCHSKEDLNEVYGLVKVGGAKKATIPEAPFMLLSAQANSASETGVLAKMFASGSDSTSRGVIPEEVINFLKYAPDLEILVDFSDNEDDEVKKSKQEVVAIAEEVGGEMGGNMNEPASGSNHRERYLQAKRNQRQYRVHLCPTFTLTSSGVVGWSGEDRIRVAGGGVTPSVVKEFCNDKKKAVQEAQLRKNVPLSSVLGDLENYHHSIPCFVTGTVMIPALLHVAAASKVVSLFHTSEEWDNVETVNKSPSKSKANRDSTLTQEEVRSRGRKSERDVHVMQDSEDAVSLAFELVSRRATQRSFDGMSQASSQGRKSVSFSQQADDDVFSQRLMQIPNGNDLLHDLEMGTSAIDGSQNE